MFALSFHKAIFLPVEVNLFGFRIKGLSTLSQDNYHVIKVLLSDMKVECISDNNVTSLVKLKNEKLRKRKKNEIQTWIFSFENHRCLFLVQRCQLLHHILHQKDTQQTQHSSSWPDGQCNPSKCHLLSKELNKKLFCLLISLKKNQNLIKHIKF